MAARVPSMSRRTRRYATGLALIFWLACLFPLADSSHALDPDKRITQYTHTSWRTQDGSLPAGMFAMAQTTDGFLWLLSNRGEIYRFDGVRYQSLRVPNQVESIGRIRNIVADRSGGLWLLGADGVAHLKNGVSTFQVQLDGLEPNPMNVSEDPDGSLWVVRGDNGITEPLCHIKQDGLTCYGKADGVPISPIDAVLADGKGGFWLGGQAALAHWHGGTSEVYPVEGLKTSMGAPGIMSLALAPDGTLWVGIYSSGYGQGLAKLKDGQVRSFITHEFDGSKLTVFSLRFDRDGNLWVGTTNQGLLRVHGNTVERYGRSDGFSGDFVRDLFEDREGTIWAATSNGLDTFHDPRVTTITVAEGLAEESAVGLLASSDNIVWVANSYSLDRIANGMITSIRTGHGLPGQQVSALLQDHAGNLWVGVDDGLYLFKNGTFHRLPDRNHRPLGMVFALAEDTEGNIWAVCAGSAQLVRIRDFQIQETFSRTQVPASRIASRPEGGIWIATRKGELGIFHRGVLKTFPVNPDPKSLVANQLMGLPGDSVFAAFDDGMVGLRQGKTQRMTRRNGLPCDGIISFVQDSSTRWWLNTQCGVVEISDGDMQQWWANPEYVVHSRLYDVLDGARPSSRPPFNSAGSSPDGRVWFVNGGVVQMLEPSKLFRGVRPAETYVDSVTVDRKELPLEGNVEIPPRPRDLQFDYTSPTFLIPQRVKFRYRLDGYDHDWHEAGTRRQAFYTDLPPRKYSFRVVASNSEGVWDETPAKLDFTVAPAYYQTNWFRALCAIFFLAGLWAIYQWHLRRLRHEFELTLDARVNERTRIARDLHDTLLQSFHGVLLRFQTAFQLLPERPLDAKESLGNAIDQAAEAITEGRDAVQGLRDSTVEGNDLGPAISTLGEELVAASAGHHPQFRVAVEGQSRHLHPIIRDDIYKITAEALRNAFHHSGAKQVEVELRYDDEQFRLRVRDDGKGIDPGLIDGAGRQGHFGLAGMRERATLIGGKMTVWSELDAGTEVELRVPANVAYVSRRKRSWFSGKLVEKSDIMKGA